MSAAKRVVMGAATPLDHAGILLHVLNILGPGRHMFISAVSKAWQESYKRSGSAQIVGMIYRCYNKAGLCTVNPGTTLYSAVFASPARVTLAHECGLTFNDDERIQRIAGKVADIPTLRAARERGLALTDKVLIGAAECGFTSRLQWLHTEQGCQLPPDICSYAARSGSIDILEWLQAHGSVYNTATCRGAAAGAHIHVLQHLRDAGCEWSGETCSAAAVNGHLATLQWLHEQGCPWHAADICDDAAQCGSIPMLDYLKQHGCAFSEVTIAMSAWEGHLAVCQYLLAEQCPYDARACAVAAENGHLETVRFLHESGCPWDVDTICSHAAESDNRELLQYLKQQGCNFSEDVMSIAAGRGDTHICQYLRAEQCPWDTYACDNAARGGHVNTLRWLHESGCPLDIAAIRSIAAVTGHLPVFMYVLGVEPAATAAQLTAMLRQAGFYNELPAAQALQQQGAEWPTELKCYGLSWPASMVQWARDEGCTSTV
jgi:hypothetical protein